MKLRIVLYLAVAGAIGYLILSAADIVPEPLKEDFDWISKNFTNLTLLFCFLAAIVVTFKVLSYLDRPKIPSIPNMIFSLEVRSHRHLQKRQSPESRAEWPKRGRRTDDPLPERGLVL